MPELDEQGRPPPVCDSCGGPYGSLRFDPLARKWYHTAGCDTGRVQTIRPLRRYAALDPKPEGLPEL